MFECINGWTKRKMLNVIRKRKYKEAAYDSHKGFCMYLMPNGNQCAVGMFIPKDHEGLGVEGGVVCLLNKHPDLENELPLSMEGLCRMQEVHDLTSNRRNAKDALIAWVKENVKG